MAKAKKEEGSAVDDIFQQLINQHNDEEPGSAMLGEDMDSEITTWIDSGSKILNMVLSNKADGGWPCGRVIQVYGPEGIGKSTLGYVAEASVQKQGGIVIHFDIEHAANKSFMSMLGVDLKKMIWSDISTVEKLFSVMEKNLQMIIQSGKYKGKPVIIIVDSVTALQTDTEEEGGYEFNMNVSLGKAKSLGKALKKIIRYLNDANACLFLVDQVRDNVTGYGDKYVVGGGKAIPFYSSVRVLLDGRKKIMAKDPTVENEYQLALAQYKKDKKTNPKLEKPERPKTDEVCIGYEVEAYTKKNKTAPPDRRGHFQIKFSEGLSDQECYLDYCIKFGLIKQSGAFCEIVAFPNDIGKFYKSEWFDKVLCDVDVYNKIENLLIQKLTVKIKNNKNDYVIVEEDVDESQTGYIKKEVKNYSDEDSEEQVKEILKD